MARSSPNPAPFGRHSQRKRLPPFADTRGGATAISRNACLYDYRLFDRYALPIASLALLTDEEEKGWRDHSTLIMKCRFEARLRQVPST
uniref:Uncharacterized protein n=1 Tax=Candidatus Kentrum sp. TC TaxID=2126339 RepID=A0A451AD13_9GAMM|nr:MAG: hypothetical protein BECKTC1821F_GA0114240_11096 [Candidatus Kentron sp. TC]